ncbi:type III secretion protein L [Pseudomonas antarctica]|uniref:Type III secretion protein L n=1 Tax=Pseudomonas antarctica TaxID=219572 RepID=A0A1H0EF39_9PSED|nr:type III secretion system stator protein SctL [Pseudomonas antarctica]KAF2408229.1 V-type proton ATPase subunit E [Pseudomonas antarctica]SDN80921.1 type III secretion protein L [Pseudomonas antarctica]
MFCTQRIELHARSHDLSTALIPREMLAEYTQARHILEQAETQAEALIRQAESQCENILESASNEFWQRANAQLHRWESERQAMFDQLETAASSVINTAIRSLLEETVPAQRLTVLLNKLLAAQFPTVEANLLCNPSDREHVEQWLSRHCNVPWALRVEDGLAARSLILETEDGGFHINWTDAVDNLVIIPPEGRYK